MASLHHAASDGRRTVHVIANKGSTFSVIGFYLFVERPSQVHTVPGPQWNFGPVRIRRQKTYVEKKEKAAQQKHDAAAVIHLFDQP